MYESLIKRRNIGESFRMATEMIVRHEMELRIIQRNIIDSIKIQKNQKTIDSTAFPPSDSAQKRKIAFGLRGVN